MPLLKALHTFSQASISKPGSPLLFARQNSCSKSPFSSLTRVLEKFGANFMPDRGQISDGDWQIQNCFCMKSIFLPVLTPVLAVEFGVRSDAVEILKVPTPTGQLISTGQANIRFASPILAESALRSKNGKNLGKHTIECFLLAPQMQSPFVGEILGRQIAPDCRAGDTCSVKRLDFHLRSTSLSLNMGALP